MLQILLFILIDFYQLLVQASLLTLWDAIYGGAVKLNVLANPHAYLFFAFGLFPLSTVILAAIKSL